MNHRNPWIYDSPDLHVGRDESSRGTPLLDVSTSPGGANLTPGQAEELGRALLAWAADPQGGASS